MIDPKTFLLLALLSIWSTASITAVNISDCVTNPTGKVSFDVVGVPGPKGELGETGIQGQKGSSGEKGKKGARGYPGERGPVGGPGLPGVIGPHGYTGDTVLTEGEFARATQTVQQNISAQLKDIRESLSDIKSAFTKCGIYDTNWRRVAYIDTTQGSPCPSGLREVTNSALNKRACGRSVNTGCSSVTFPSGGSYTHVCGRARGYQFGEPDAFHSSPDLGINSHYIDGVSITRGSPRKHIWSYVAGWTEKSPDRHSCPCSQGGTSYVPSFVGENFYCESGFVNSHASRVAWEDPLWDGSGCFNSGNQCCDHGKHGWFHTENNPTNDYIEVRWCDNREFTIEDTLVDILEIWIL
jgi:dynein heavy chain